MSYQTIRAAQQAVWPAVGRSLALHRGHREAAHANPRLVSAAARARARVPWNRVVANETVWAIAKADLLNTPEQADVLRAARAWVKSWSNPPRDPVDLPEDIELYRAVQALVTVLDIPDDVG